MYRFNHYWFSSDWRVSFLGSSVRLFKYWGSKITSKKDALWVVQHESTVLLL